MGGLSGRRSTPFYSGKAVRGYSTPTPLPPGITLGERSRSRSTSSRWRERGGAHCRPGVRDTRVCRARAYGSVLGSLALTAPVPSWRNCQARSRTGRPAARLTSADDARGHAASLAQCASCRLRLRAIVRSDIATPRPGENFWAITAVPLVLSAILRFAERTWRWRLLVERSSRRGAALCVERGRVSRLAPGKMILVPSRRDVRRIRRLGDWPRTL